MEEETVLGKADAGRKSRTLKRDELPSAASTYLLRLSRTVFLKPTLARVATASTNNGEDA